MSSSLLARSLSGALRPARSFATSAAARKDLVQDLYLNQLKAYKPPAPVKDAHVGVVKTYALPPAPRAPALPADLAAELSAYDASEPFVAAAAAAAPAASEQAGTGVDTFLTFLEADEPKAEVHH